MVNDAIQRTSRDEQVIASSSQLVCLGVGVQTEARPAGGMSSRGKALRYKIQIGCRRKASATPTSPPRRRSTCSEGRKHAPAAP